MSVSVPYRRRRAPCRQAARRATPGTVTLFCAYCCILLCVTSNLTIATATPMQARHCLLLFLYEAYSPFACWAEINTVTTQRVQLGVLSLGGRRRKGGSIDSRFHLSGHSLRSCSCARKHAHAHDRTHLRARQDRARHSKARGRCGLYTLFRWESVPSSVRERRHGAWACKRVARASG